jgi:antitoxin component of RelBE/YafQ-DinJ toxin-antitoxin module
MSTTQTIQVRLPATLKLKSEQRAKDLGFSSVQEAIRVFLSSFAAGKVRPGIVAEDAQEYVSLSAKGKKRWGTIEQDIAQGKNIHPLNSPQDTLKWLNE